MADIYDSEGNFVGSTEEGYTAQDGDSVVQTGSGAPAGLTTAGSGGTSTGTGNTLSSIIGALGGTATQVLNANKTAAQKKPATSNTALYLAIGGAVLLLVVMMMGRRS